MNRINVTPGVYTYETDLSIVSQSLGTTSAAIVGETVKGRAFEPMIVSSYKEYKALFGGLNSTVAYSSLGEKYLKYETSYVAKEYLSEADYLCVVRVLGLSGYNAGPAHILTIQTGTTEAPVKNIVAVLRSTGKYESGLVFNAKTVALEGTPANIKADFTIKVTAQSGSATTSYVVSLDSTKKNYIGKVLSKANNSKDLIYIEDLYTNVIDSLGTTGTITLTSDTSKFVNYNREYSAAMTPWFLGEINGGVAKKLFRFITISDGNVANTETKVSIENIRPTTRTFDVVVRDFNDTDASPKVLERFSNCNLDETSTYFIGRKIGTSDGAYEIRSKYIFVELNESADISNEIPLGFLGLPIRNVAGSQVAIPFKTDYTALENKRKVYLGLESSKIDADILNYKGEENLTTTKGFHLENQSTKVTVDGVQFNIVVSSGATIDFDSEETLSGTQFKNVSERKFLVPFYGGFDGWDIHRTNRTNEVGHAYTKFISSNGTLDQTKLTKEGFKVISLDGIESALNSDYYAFLNGVLKVSNPFEIDINVLATPGIDFDRNSNLVSEIIDIVEVDRADSVYIINSPNKSSVSEVVDALGNSGIDSNYSATYFPHKQYADSENNVYVNMSPTADVLRNIAIIDKRSQPWFSVAGLDRGDVKCVKALKKLRLNDSNALYSANINPIMTFRYDGVKIWGNKTLQINDESALTSLNVRRLLLQARKLISNAAKRLVFDQNDNDIRSEFLKLVNPILEDIRVNRGLREFRIEVDESVDSYENKELNAKIIIKPTKSLEYINIDFGVTDQGVWFDNI